MMNFLRKLFVRKTREEIVNDIVNDIKANQVVKRFDHHWTGELRMISMHYETREEFDAAECVPFSIVNHYNCICERSRYANLAYRDGKFVETEFVKAPIADLCNMMIHHPEKFCAEQTENTTNLYFIGVDKPILTYQNYDDSVTVGKINLSRIETKCLRYSIRKLNVYVANVKDKKDRDALGDLIRSVVGEST